MPMLEHLPDVLRVDINARLLDGYSEESGRSLFDGREIEVRPMDNAD
jgi:hypothetical protein